MIFVKYGLKFFLISYILSLCIKKINLSHPKSGRKCVKIRQEILKTLVQRGKALELNTSGYLGPQKEPHPPEYILRRYRDLGGELITIGSDAHVPEHAAQGLEQGTELLRQCGFSYITQYKNRKPLQKRI